MSRRAHAARARAAFRRAEMAKRTSDHIVAQLPTNAAQRYGRTRVSPLQRGVLRHAHAHHARTI
eukprot:2697587-Lingulodinium_polyedra.AAC.1